MEEPGEKEDEEREEDEEEDEEREEDGEEDEELEEDMTRLTSRSVRKTAYQNK